VGDLLLAVAVENNTLTNNFIYSFFKPMTR